MKKLFFLFAAVLMAGSMMAEPILIKFDYVQPATEVAGSTYGDEGYGFTLEIPATSDKAQVDASSCTFGVSAEETISFTHRLKTGSASSKDGRIFTLNIPEEGPLVIYARTAVGSATDRSFLIANGADTIVYHICLDTDVVEGTSIFKPVIVENVPAGSYKITYNNGINFYGFQLGYEAPAAVDLTFESAGFYGYDYDEDEENPNWYLAWKDQSVICKVNLTRTTNLDNKYGHFTTADFDLSLSRSTIYLYGGDEYDLTAVDVTLTKTETGLTMTGYVVGANGVTYNLDATYSAPAGVVSKTTFSTLADLEGMTITFADEMPEFDDCFSIRFRDSSEKIVYYAAPAEGGVLFSNNVLTINSFDSEYEYPLPTEEMDLTIVLTDAFDGYAEVTAGTIHFNPNPTALENNAVEMKVEKTIENGQMVIIRDDKKYNAVGAEL